eukprot:12391682-Alexandrium_andersonii.AAC.1
MAEAAMSLASRATAPRWQAPWPATSRAPSANMRGWPARRLVRLRGALRLPVGRGARGAPHPGARCG